MVTILGENGMMRAGKGMRLVLIGAVGAMAMAAGQSSAAPKDFAALAKKYSDDKNSKDKGGELSPFAKNQLPFKEFEFAAFSLKSNQVSEVVTTRLGYHIIKLDESIPSKKLELAEVSEKVKAYLENVEMQKALPALTADLKKKADIQILDDQVKTLLTEAEIKLKASEDKQSAPIPLPSTNSTTAKP